MNSDLNLEAKRHSLAHLLAAAVLELYPDTRNTLGPAVENGFYYDFDFLTPISDKDLNKIENKMREISKSWNGFSHKEAIQEEADILFEDNPYKLELIKEIVSRGEKITLYTSGDFTDLCRGGHVEDFSEIAKDSWRLSHIAGAYWRGDEKNKMLTRIYGLAFNSGDDLVAYEKRMVEAKERDHRKLGKELDLFTFSDLVGSGLPLFTPRGQAMRESITDFLWSLSKKYGYQKVQIPHIAKLELYETSGHAEKFRDEFFYVDGAQSGQKFVMKPMNCPHHTQIFAAKPRSYKNLPLRFTELTMQYRDEKPGELLGLSRVRSITIDDAHIFCKPEDIKIEVTNIVKIIEEFYQALGMWNKGKTFWVSLSVRDPKTPEKYLGDSDNWDKAERYLQEVSVELGLDAKRMEGEAAFYGPKLDFMFTDALGRERQLATAQVDFVQPQRFGLEYTASSGERATPVMIHRAVAGSLERFMAILIEHFAGNFPLWLSPTQVKIVPVRDSHDAHARELFNMFVGSGIRAEIDESDVNLGKKIRAAKVEKAPYWIVVGDKEMESGKYILESSSGKKMEPLGGDAISDLLLKQISDKSLLE
ncbi:MAG: threonine--tRNA ligase [Candidatus Taylorbacteria bacterium RIFCSPLOWO2_01_FULL_45_15b]|uniref:Threonine--tRNA ligase n=1 Tax=Candidatus Taylorbacteria bacterium RIFCSPLOWO2_01_FULL_45_15b TaxID=1802319 RepID=A0A1G2NAD1_9BACT|nr:MAG: threonine--tRNA ligase [Candidatus Taylorbacteria bacterium RIFCSPLOWO2_01_FULL_45_15b]